MSKLFFAMIMTFICCEIAFADQYPVRLTDISGIRSVEEVSKLRNDPSFGILEYKFHDGRHLKITTCKEFDESNIQNIDFSKGGYDSTTTSNASPVMEAIMFPLKCRFLNYLIIAKPSVKSFLSNLKVEDIPPPDLYPNILQRYSNFLEDREFPEQKHRIKTNHDTQYVKTKLESFIPKPVRKKGDYYIIYNYVLWFQIIAFGDFNHDGNEDVLTYLHFAIGDYNHNGTGSGPVILTKLEENGKFIDITP